jgi:hypothetical protein
MGRRGHDVTPELVTEPSELARDDTPAGRYMAAFANGGTAALVANASSRPMLLRHRGRSFPVTRDDGGYGRSYVASPHSAYVLYARAEMEMVGMRRGRRSAAAALSVLDRLLRAARFNHVVHLDNWLLSTNLHGDWDGDGLPAIRQALADIFPDHFLILRSLDPWSCPALLAAARADGWMLLPARQIWVVDDLARDWRPRHDRSNDRRALSRSGLLVQDLERIDATDAARIAELYHLLYVGRYSALNPVFTERYMAFTAATGLISYRVARDPGGRIMAVAGMLARNGIMTPPVVGYDTPRPQRDALYRIASYLFSDWALERGLALHGSAGAATFKRNRGAHGVIEYMAVHAGHLSRSRRTAIGMLANLLERFAVPMMRKQGW